MILSNAISGIADDGPLATASCGKALRTMPHGACNGGGKYLSHTFGLARASMGEVCRTLTKEPHRLGHPSGERYLSIQAAKRIGSFPDQFAMNGKYEDRWNRIGNSVPPLFMRAIARHIRRLEPLPLSAPTYKQTLDAGWSEHVAPRAHDAPTVISTFAGAGGSSLGYSMAGFHELLAVEWDANAVATFKLNFPDVPVYHGDIGKLSVDDVLKRTGLKAGELDVFDGSPPCQGFSTAGKRDFADTRNQLFREYARLLRGLQPKVFMMENVSGMVKGDMKLIFADVLRELKGCGYSVKARLLNAMYFGVPQSRERMIFIGVRNDRLVTA